MTPVLRDIAIIGGGCYGTFYAGQLALARDRGKLEYRRVLVVDHDPACRAANELPPRPDRELVIDDWDRFLDRFLGVEGDRDRSGRAHFEAGKDPAGTRRAPPIAPRDLTVLTDPTVLTDLTVPTDPTDLTAPDDAIVPSPLMPHLMARWLERRARSRWPDRLVEQRTLAGLVGTPYESTGPDGTRYLSHADWICPVHCIEPLVCPVIRGPRTWDLAETLAAFTADAGLGEPATFQCHHQAFGVGMFRASEAQEGWQRVAAAGTGGEPADVVIGTVSRCHGAVTVLHLGREPGRELEA